MTISCQDVQKVIRVFSSFLYGSPKELGWDPTMQVVNIGGAPQYRITVFSGEEARVYETTRTLSNFAADALLSRGTRVWEAKNDEDLLVALKDVWLVDDYPREGEILATILNRLADQTLEEAKGVFLGVVQHGDVVIDGLPDHTLANIIRNQDLPNGGNSLPFYVAPIPKEFPKEQAVGNPRTPLPSLFFKPMPREPQHRAHYRIVFKEVGTALQNVTPKQRCQALVGAVKGMSNMYIKLDSHAYTHTMASSPENTPRSRICPPRCQCWQCSYR
jgi:hypothetical protein